MSFSQESGNPRQTTRLFPSRISLGIILVLLSATGFAAKGILAKMAYGEGLNPSTVLSMRMLSVLPVYLSGLVWFGRRGPGLRPDLRHPDFWKVVLLGLLGFDLSAVLDFDGLLRIGAGLERLVLFLYPTFVIFLSALMKRRGIGLREILSSLLAYGGLLVITGGHVASDAGERAGVLLVLGSGIFYAVYLVGVERVVRRVDPLYLTSLVMVVATSAIVFQAIFSGTFHPGQANGRALFLIGIMGIFSTALPTFFMTAGISLIGASRAALLSFFGPVVTLVMAAIFLGERMDVREGAGAFLIILGVGMVAFGGEKGQLRKSE
ncbi:MAG: DMT family transporter [Nitrospirae bacterium]|nr:DMT family transporter [Nitrospirota bacterium]MCL5285108.1 DMT family transporter [Nitrospirota bacterium]